MKRFVLVAVLAVLAVMESAAHPHVFIDAQLEFVFDGETCLGFWQEWTFDAVFSMELRYNFDADRNGSFSKAEQEDIHDGAFSNLRRYGYYTLLRKGAARSSPSAVENFSARLHNERAVYRFFVPLEGKGYTGSFSVAVFDTTYYSAVRYSDALASAQQRRPDASAPLFSRQVDKRYPVYYNPMGGAQDMTTYKAPAPGLQTVYPEEILVQFK
jgi:ABC-type uncharacterized transport system substrate-binding protein